MNSGHSRLVDMNGIRLHYFEWGEEANPALILLHGGSAHAHWWDHIAPSLARTFRGLAFDLRGHGDSSWIEPAAYEIQDYVADLEAVITTLQLDSPSLLGHSLGGFIALNYATRHAASLRAFIKCRHRPSAAAEPVYASAAHPAAADLSRRGRLA